MKKLIIVLVFLAVISPVFSQSNTGINYSSDMYYLNVPVEKIYPSSMGYVIQYRQLSSGRIGTIGIPNNWFQESAGKAELIRLPPGANYPTMSVFFVDGEFNHVRLYIHRDKGHQTWGNIPMGMDVSMHFRNPDSLEIDF